MRSAMSNQRQLTGLPAEEPLPHNETEIFITKPSAFDLDKFKFKRAATLASGETLQTALPHHRRLGVNRQNTE
jgi:hypothetical protein